MKKIAVVFWSGTGNTEAMANAVAEGIREAGGSASQIAAADFASGSLGEYDAFAFGCPSMGSEVLEEDEFEPMFNSCRDGLNGRNVALFGSYGWGDGEWMRNWEDDCRSAGINLVFESVICMEAPDDEAVTACKALGAALVS